MIARRRKRIHTHVTIVLTVVIVVLTAIWLFSYTLDGGAQHVSLTRTFHVNLSEGCVSCFNDSAYGPYRGSIIAIVDREGHTHPDFLRRTAWSLPGFYYRCFRTESDTLWTLTVSLLWPISGATVSLLMTLAMNRLRRTRNLTEA